MTTQQLKRFQKTLSETGFDGALISSELHQRYLSGFDYTDGYILVTPTNGFLLCDFRYIEAAHAQVKGFEIIRPKGSMMDAVAELANSLRLNKVLVEEDNLSVASFEKLTEKFGEVKLVVGASAILDRQRAVKLPYEIELMKKAQTITDMAFTHILDYLNYEVTELDVALELEFFMRQNGAESAAFDTISVSGPSSSLPHGVPSNVKLRRGFLTMDFGAKVDGYCSDMTRTVVIGGIDDEMKKVYDTVLAAQLNALENIHDGIVCREADELARSVIRNAGYGDAFGHSLGHGVGMLVHENPRLAPSAKEDSILLRGNVVTVEPGIYLAGRFGVRIEDMIAVSDDGSIYNFTESPKEMIVI